MAKHKVLSTKKLEPSLVELAKQNDIEIIEKEFISIKPTWNQETFDRIIGLANDEILNIAVTSANAVDALNRYMHVHDTYHIINWNVFCLSGKTKQAVLNARFLETNIIGEAKNASELAQEIIKAKAKEIIFFCGNKRRDALPALLNAANIKVHEVILYETVETSEIVGNDYDAVLFFSPTGVQSFFSSNELKKDTVCFAIGPTTATSIATFTTNKIIDSLAPAPALMVEEVIEHLNKKQL